MLIWFENSDRPVAMIIIVWPSQGQLRAPVFARSRGFEAVDFQSKASHGSKQKQSSIHRLTHTFSFIDSLFLMISFLSDWTNNTCIWWELREMETLPDELLLKIFNFSIYPLYPKSLTKCNFIESLKTIVALKFTCVTFFTFIENFKSEWKLATVELDEEDLVIKKEHKSSFLTKTLCTGLRRPSRGQNYRTIGPLVRILESLGVNLIRLNPWYDRGYRKFTIDVQSTVKSVPAILCNTRKGNTRRKFQIKLNSLFSNSYLCSFLLEHKRPCDSLASFW